MSHPSPSNPFDTAMEQLHKAAAFLDHGSLKNKLEELKKPQRIINVSIPIDMDDGSVKTFQGYRVQYNNTLGPYKGGIRFHPQVTINEIKALSFWMMMKCAVAGLPMGGGKGGIVVNPKELSERELEQLSRAYVRAIAQYIGPDKDVPAPDVNTNGMIMGWMVDEFIKIKSAQNIVRSPQVSLDQLRATFTGKLMKDGGSEGREEATGKGGVYVLDAVLRKLGIDKKQKPLTVAVQGFGNVGYNIAKLLSDEGYNVVAVSDSKGGIYVPEGLHPASVLTCKKQTGMIDHCYCIGSVCDVKKAKRITNEELLELPVDILVPAALENALNASNAARIKAKIVFEMANGPTTSEADALLYKEGRIVVPDVLANSGGVTVSTFEWEQNLKGEHWTKEEVNRKLQKKMEDAVSIIWDTSKKYKTGLRTAAFIVAIQRIAS
jgi:glutamate dehydrogenase/leucine dehydrogenase